MYVTRSVKDLMCLYMVCHKGNSLNDISTPLFLNSLLFYSIPLLKFVEMFFFTMFRFASINGLPTRSDIVYYHRVYLRTFSFEVRHYLTLSP